MGKVKVKVNVSRKVKDGKNNSPEEKIRVGDKGRRRKSKKKWT